jgi:beta-lactamase regulating signal transducer with metallopeptidase domain
MMPDTAVASLASLLNWLAKSFLIMGCAFLADLLLRRAHASLRHWIWLAGLAAGILLPVVSYLVPSFNGPIFHLNFLGADPVQGSAAAGGETGQGWSASELLLGAYVAGALLVLAWQLVGRAYAAHLRSSAAKITDSQAIRELCRLKAALGIHVPVDLLASNRISIPFSTGYFRPVIVLPQATSLWPAPVLASVLVHELAHIKRKDIFARIVAQISCCIHWIDPLAWYGLGRIIMEQEIACDHQVLGTGTKPSDYARNLLALSEARRGRLDFALTALGRRTELKSRLLEILKPTRSRTPVRVGGSLVFAVLTLGLILPVSALHLWDVPDVGLSRNPPGLSQGQPSPLRLQPLSSNPQSLKSSPALPDFETAKQKFSNKLQEMKAQGVPQEQLDQFAAEAKLKLTSLQNEKRKQDEINKQIELQRMRNDKEAK